ncbi:MAG: metallophosphoesterase [Solirubrobacteraceae bacterium]
MTVAALAVVLAVVPAGALAGNGEPVNGSSKNPLTMAVIGDTPYGAEQIERFPALVEDINADPKVRLVLHLGDVKNGSSPCTDERLKTSRDLYETFKDPFVLTPGDNDWTDCHRAAAGGYLPTERLDAVREIFYPQPGRTLGGRSKRVLTQADQPGFGAFVENQLWMESQVVFSAVHVVGSKNDLAPWFGAAETEEQRELRLEEYRTRLAADLAWLDRTFATAQEEDARGVVVAMQADTFRGSQEGFEEILDRLTELAREFDGQVLLLQGDSHEYLVDRPLPDAPNLTRIVVEGETAGEWLRLRIDPRADQLFSWTREQL